LPAVPGETAGPRARVPGSATRGYHHPVRIGLNWRTGLPGGSAVRSTDLPALARRGAVAVAAGRVAIGLTALAWPSVPSRPWVGVGADDLVARVFARSLGARDLALGLGALAVLRDPGAESGSASLWVAAGAVSDALDVVASLLAWRELPRIGRWLVVSSAAAAAVTGAAGALAVRSDRAGLPTPG
jgi:hypothetical protein